jgi:parvulin-like peptidyl-prolyl isomerase
MAAPRKSPFLFVLCILAVAYLVGDLFVFKGPLRWRIDLGDPFSDASIRHAKSIGIVARVAGRPISQSQLERAVREKLWLEGKSPESLAPAEMNSVRHAALEELIDHELLRSLAAASGQLIPVEDEELHERLRRLVGRFETKGTLEAAMKTQGIPNEQALRDRLTAQIRHEKFIASRISETVRVSDEEAMEWYEKNRQSLVIPERIQVRHLFLPTLDQPAEEAKEKLEAALATLLDKTRDFATLAREISQDPATKDKGGQLGWMTRERLPRDFSAPVFSMPVHQPALVRTRLGWHLVEVTARKAAEPRSFEQAKPEIVASLETVKRRQAIADFRRQLRDSGRGEIQIL